MLLLSLSKACVSLAWQCMAHDIVLGDFPEF